MHNSKAGEHYLELVRRRPVSASTWGSSAEVHVYLHSAFDTFDDECEFCRMERDTFGKLSEHGWPESAYGKPV